LTDKTLLKLIKEVYDLVYEEDLCKASLGNSQTGANAAEQKTATKRTCQLFKSCLEGEPSDVWDNMVNS